MKEDEIGYEIRTDCAHAVNNAVTLSSCHKFATGTGSETDGRSGVRRRCSQMTSCHRSNLKPICRKTPIGTNPNDSCKPTLDAFGNVIPAYAFTYPCLRNKSRS